MLPPVPEKQRPKKCPHMGLDELTQNDLRAQGWEPVDVRLLPNQTDGDRADAVKSYLEGVRLGTITGDVGLLKFLELEARVYGLTSGKSQASRTTQVNDDDSDTIEAILDFGKEKTWSKTSSPATPGKPRGPKWQPQTSK